MTTTIDPAEIQAALPKRQRDANKGHFGHILIIGGDFGMGGAARMAGEAALRVGAGLVSVATRPEHIVVVSAMRPEIMVHGIETPDDLSDLLKRTSVIAIGPGLGQSDWSKACMQAVLSTSQPKVLDADALNILAQMPVKANNWILTPHPGEAARLLNCEPADIQQDRLKAVCSLQKRYGGVVVLKGAGTLVKAADAPVRVCRAGNPGMATAGMGDSLTGVIAGLLGQHLTLTQAASVGVLLHAQAGDQAALALGERGLCATDLLPFLHQGVNTYD